MSDTPPLPPELVDGLTELCRVFRAGVIASDVKHFAEQAARLAIAHRDGQTVAEARSQPFDTDNDGDDLCPNCCTPWKCNGPHLDRATLLWFADQIAAGALDRQEEDDDGPG